MTKKLKAAIFAAAFISLGGAAYTYDRYGVQDNSTLLANIEAMSCNNEENKENSEGGNGGNDNMAVCSTYYEPENQGNGTVIACGNFLKGFEGTAAQTYDAADKSSTAVCYLDYDVTPNYRAKDEPRRNGAYYHKGKEKK